MKINTLRWLILIVAFCVLLYGAYVGLDLGKAIPAFSCRFVRTRGGTCFLESMQIGLGLLTPQAMLIFAKRFVLFSLLVLLLGRTWCGWLCPMGFVQDVLDWLRRLLGIGYTRFSARLNQRLEVIKWTFLAVAVLLPIWVAFPAFFPNVAVKLNLPFASYVPEDLFCRS